MSFSLNGFVESISKNTNPETAPEASLPAAATWVDPKAFPFFANTKVAIQDGSNAPSFNTVNVPIPIKASEMSQYQPGTKITFPAQIVTPGGAA